MPVHVSKAHKDSPRGDPNMKYASTSKIGNTTVHIIAPPPMTDEEREQIDKEIHTVVWEILERIEREKQSATTEETSGEVKRGYVKKT